MTDDYSPFPEQGLEDVAKYHDDAAGIWGEGTWANETHKISARYCRDALKSFIALRERCLLAEMDRNQLALKLDGKANAA